MRLHLLVTCLGLAACAGGSRSVPAPPPPPPAAPDAAVTATAETAPAPMALADSGIVPAWLDRAADPCTDFFAHACGGFLATAVIPPDRSSWSAIQVVNQGNEQLLRDVLERAAAAATSDDPVTAKLGAYYAACMDEAGVDAAGATPLAPLLAIVDRVVDPATAAAAVTALHAEGVFPFFDLGPTQDFADATQVIASLDQAGLGLPDRDYYVERAGNMVAVRAAYRAHVGRMFGLLGWPAARAKAATADVLRIETALARLQQKEVFRRDPHNIYHRVERAGLVKVAGGFPWAAYFAGVGLPDVTAINAHDPAYFTALVALLRRERPAALRSYLTWTVVHAHADQLARPFVDEDLALQRALSGVTALAPRWRRCVERADADLGELLGQAYVAARFSVAAKARAVELTEQVFAAMRAELDALPWMDPATRAAAAAKLGAMSYLVGYPDTWRRYDVAVSRADHLGNVRAAARHEQARRLAKIGRPVDHHDWDMTPPTVNAYYDGSLNQIVLPAGQLQPPFFGATFHPAVNFGSTGGGTIGHEMTHGFDDEGSQFDGAGNLREWWSAATRAQFATATRCVIDQYAAYAAVPGVFIDGALTAGENIADIGGVKLGFQAYQRWRAAQPAPPPAQVEGYSDDQLYFLAYAQSWCAKVTPEAAETRAHSDPHAPPRWRVNGVVVDQPGFAAAFGCAVGAPMRPATTCAVW